MADTFPTSTCRGCTGRIIWASTVTPKAMPVDVDPSPDGTLMLYRMANSGRIRADLVASEAERTRLAGQLRTSHFATCPAAGTFRKPRNTTHKQEHGGRR